MAKFKNYLTGSVDFRDYIQDYEHEDANDNLLLDNIKTSNYVDIEQMNGYLKSDTCNRLNDVYVCSILHLNIQSLPSKFEKFKLKLSLLEENNIKLDFILLCETYLHSGNFQLYSLPG